LVERNIESYNLDVIISVGYRVKSKRGTQFRMWANQVIKDHLVKGYSINKKRLEQTEQEIKFLRSGIQIVSRAIEEKSSEKGLEWLNRFATGLALLDDYDHENLDAKGLTTRKAVYPKRREYQALIDQMKQEFDSDIFGLEKDQSFESAIAQISKGFGENDFYPSLEEKAATLLYLIVKNHAFTDGNKRIAAACFLMFLEYNDILIDKTGSTVISNEALASLTLFIAASRAEEMETVKKLTVSILNRNKIQSS
jgi:death-on-curing family protein